VVPPEEPSQLAQALRALLSDRQKMQLFGASGRAYVTAQLSWPVLVRSWLAQLSGNPLCSPNPATELDLKREAANVPS